eukprot:749821-Hanusia_phi.AAC.5
MIGCQDIQERPQLSFQAGRAPSESSVLRRSVRRVLEAPGRGQAGMGGVRLFARLHEAGNLQEEK